MTQPGTGIVPLGKSIEAQGLTYVDSNGNPLPGLNIAGLQVTINNPAIVSASYDAANSAWKFTGLAAGSTGGNFVDPVTGIQDNFNLTVPPADAGIEFASWSAPA